MNVSKPLDVAMPSGEKDHAGRTWVEVWRADEEESCLHCGRPTRMRARFRKGRPDLPLCEYCR